ncbi:MAG: phosphatase PAP2 family protein [Lachnospiraceae bacterium]|nr:phosphatase PAP2 family protein [Lachnospiraceae bacterium]
MAEWLNSFFAQYDYMILNSLHQLAVATEGAVTPLFMWISSLGNWGIAEIVLGLVLLCFKKTRKMGVCVLLAIVFGAVITNVVVKNYVARPRPFIDTTGIYYEWWEFVGGIKEPEYSFPSGHTTAAMASVTAVVLNSQNKHRWWLFLFVVVMGISRNYLMVHYPSDILGGIVAGGLAAMVAFGLVNKIGKRI